jgi:hypothetical protein
VVRLRDVVIVLAPLAIAAGLALAVSRGLLIPSTCPQGTSCLDIPLCVAVRGTCVAEARNCRRADKMCCCKR